MSYSDLAALFLILGIVFLSSSALWQMYVMLSETYTLNRYSGQRKMLWIAIVLFFSFSLAVYFVCPNARKKGVIFWLLGTIGAVCYLLGMYYKRLAMC